MYVYIYIESYIIDLYIDIIQIINTLISYVVCHIYRRSLSGHARELRHLVLVLQCCSRLDSYVKIKQTKTTQRISCFLSFQHYESSRTELSAG